MQPLLRFLAGLALVLVVVPLAAWGFMRAHEPGCPWGEAFWTGDDVVGEGPVRGLLLGSSRTGADVDMAQLAAEAGGAWQRIARHTLSESALPPSYPALLASSRSEPGLDVLVIEVSPLLYDEVSCSRPPQAHIPMMPQWVAAAGWMGIEGRPSALAMTILPHRWLAGSGRRHDLVQHAKAPGHTLAALGTLEPGRSVTRWPGEPAPDLTEKTARNRREFLLGAKLDAWKPSVHAGCITTLETVVRAAQAERTFLVMLPMRPMLRDTVEPDYWAAARTALRDTAGRLPRTALLDFSTRYDAEPEAFNDFDHLNAEGARRFTAELAEVVQ